MVGFEVLAGLREETALVFAQAVLLLLFAGGEAKVRGRPANVVNIALKVRILCDLLGFAHDRIVRPRLNVAPLMEGEGAEVARAEAAPVVDDRELHLLNGGHAALRLVGRVVGAHEGQAVDVIHFGRAQRQGGRVLDEHALAVGLADGAAAYMVGLVVLQLDRPRVGGLIGQNVLVGRTIDGRKRNFGVRVVEIGHAADLAHGVRAPFSGLEIARQRDDRVLAHAVHQAVRARGGQDGGHDLIAPVVVMGEAAQTGLDAADVDGHIGEGAAGEHGIDGHGAVGALAAHPARGVGVVVAALFGGGVVGDHRVDVARVDEHGVARTAHRNEIGFIPEIGLGEDGDAEARVLEHARDDRRAEGGVVDVGVARDEQEIAVIPAARLHVRPGDRQKIGHI